MNKDFDEVKDEQYVQSMNMWYNVFSETPEVQRNIKTLLRKHKIKKIKDNEKNRRIQTD